MRKYIDADELKKSFSCEEDAEYCRWTLAGVIGEIDDIEAADVAEVRHGRWVDYSDAGYYECSVCGEAWTFIDGTPKDNNANYCPRCGAKMVNEDD